VPHDLTAQANAGTAFTHTIVCARCGNEVTLTLCNQQPPVYCSPACRKRARQTKTRRRSLARETVCHYCLGLASTVDHIIPLSLGGPRGDLRNQVPACARCNKRKRSTWPTCTCPRCWLAVELFGPQATTQPKGPGRATQP
jgi:hypothetical protein